MQYNISHQSGDCIVSDGSSDESSITYRVNESQVKMNDRQESATKPHPHHAVAEFLFQLTKMLQDDNRVYIEWINGKIEVHDPQALADNVLGSYFRHNNYASFQRQLNYFGFKKIAGKGKLSPCSYTNEGTDLELESLLRIRRKTNTTKRRRKSDSQNKGSSTKACNPRKSGISSNKSARPSPFLNNIRVSSEGIYSNDNIFQSTFGAGNGSIVSEEEFGDFSRDDLSVNDAGTGVDDNNVDIAHSTAIAAMNAAVNALVSDEDFFENRTYREFEKKRVELGDHAICCLSRNSSLIDLAMGVPSNDISAISLANLGVPNPINNNIFD
jgi:hypothetical protein